MDTFVSRKRRRLSESEEAIQASATAEDDTDFKLALLASLHPNVEQTSLLEALLVSEGSVEAASDLLKKDKHAISPRKKQSPSNGVGYQASLASFNIKPESYSDGPKKRLLTKKGKTLHLYSPEDIAAHTPCSIIHNFLSPQEAEALLLELLQEAPTFRRERFQLFDRTVESPHTMSFYVDSWDEAERQKTDYVYNGNRISDVRQSLPEMLKIRSKVEVAVNDEIKKRIRDFYPDGKKLQYQSPDEWRPNAAFVNCYDGGAERCVSFVRLTTYTCTNRQTLAWGTTLINSPISVLTPSLAA
jgi:hypothetical protein